MFAARLRGSGCRLGCPAQRIPRKIGVKESRLKIPLRRLYPKSSKTIISELAVGFKKCCRRLKNGCPSRALSPPRLAAGAGDRNTETLKDFYVFGPRVPFSARLLFRSDPSVSRASQSNLKAHPGQHSNVRCASPPPPEGGTSLFPAKKGSEKGSAESVAGVARKPDFLQKSG